MSGEPGESVDADVEAAIDAYIEAWNEPSASGRAALLERATTEDCSFESPLGSLTGRGALAAQIAEARDLLPGAVVARVGPARRDTDVSFRWRIQTDSGTTVAEGVDVVEVVCGRLCTIRVLRPEPPG